MSHGQAMRSTLAFSRVTHFIAATSVLRTTPSCSMGTGLRDRSLRVEGGFQPAGQFLRSAFAPEVGEVVGRFLADHVVVYGDDVDVRLAEGAEYGLDLARRHD